MKTKIVICQPHRFELWNPPPWIAQRLREDFPGVDAVHLPSYDRLPQEIAGAEVFVGLSLRPEQFRAAPQLRWIHSPAAAVHQLLTPEVINSDVVVTNAASVHGPVVAEHAFALLIALAKRLPQAMKLQGSRAWGQEALWQSFPRPRELDGGVVCLIGLGSIGCAFAKMARAFNLRVLAVREHPERGSATADEVFPTARLDEVLPRADHVVIAAPLTAETRGLIGAHRLALMKPDSYLINVSRGALVDEVALVDALQKNKLGGAALDVFVTEPLPSESPLWQVERLLITPHTAALTDRLWERHYELLAENLRRFLDGGKLLGVVEKRLGY